MKTLRSVLLVFCIAISLIFALLVFTPLVPARIPAHFNMRGEVTRIGSKYELLIMPFITLAALGIHLWGAKKVKKLAAGTINAAILEWSAITVAAVFLFIQYKMLKASGVFGTPELTSTTPYALLGLMMIILGNLMPKNRWRHFGLRTPWAKSSDEAWRRSQRLGGITFVLCGLVFLTAGLFWPLSDLSREWFCAVTLGLGLLISYAGTYFIAKRVNGTPQKPSGKPHRPTQPNENFTKKENTGPQSID